MRIVLAAWACLLASLASAQAPVPEAERLAAADRLLKATHYEATLRADRADISGVVRGAESDCRRDHLSDEACTPNLERARQLAIAVETQRDAMLPDVLNAARTAYATHLTTQEMDEVTAFYVSPVGLRLQAELPAINTDIRAAQGRILLQWLAHQEPAR